MLYSKKGEGIEASTGRDRNYKSKVNSPETPPRRRFFQRVLKVAASFFTPPNASTSSRETRERRRRRKTRRGWERKRGKSLVWAIIFSRLGEIKWRMKGRGKKVRRIIVRVSRRSLLSWEVQALVSAWKFGTKINLYRCVLHPMFSNLDGYHIDASSASFPLPSLAFTYP